MARTIFPHNIKFTRTVGLIAGLLSLGIFCFAGGAWGAAKISPKRVLIFSSFGRDMAPSNATAVSFRTAIVQELGEPVDIDDATVDAARFGEPMQEAAFVNLLQKRFAGRRIDLVVALAFPAAQFVTRYRERLFGTAPLLITGIDERRLRPEFLTKDTAVLPYKIDPPGFVEGILAVLPDTKNIAVVLGASPLERFWGTEFRREFRPFNGRLSFTWFNNLSFEEIKKRSAALPANSAILYPFLMLDAAGVPYTDDVALKSLSETANAPVFVFFESQFGQGVVGGALLPNRMLGVEAARVAVRILRGETASAIPTKTFGAGTPVYDWHELRRWNISEARLPPGSIVRFREPTFWEQHKWIIIFVLALCIIEGVFIDILLRERRRRRVAQEKLDERLRLERLLSELSNVFINVPADRIETEIQDALGRVAQALTFDIAALSLFTGRGTEGRVAHVWRAAGVPEIPSNLTDQDFPWVARELIAGRDVSLRTLKEMPQEAHVDRATYEQYQVRSTHNVPMNAGGKVTGVLGLCTVGAEREMSPELLQGQRLLAEIFTNALARKQAEESLRESEQNFRGLVESTAAVPWRADVESWVFTYVGPQAEKLLGYPLQQWHEKDFWVSHLHPDDREFAVHTCLTLSKSAGSFEFEYRMISASGKTVWVHDIVKYEHQDGKAPELRGFMIDISERKHNEAALRESEERFRLMADSAPVMIWMSGTDKLCNYFNKAWLDFTGRSMEQELGNGWADGVHPEDFDRCLGVYVNAFDTRQEFTMEYRLRKHDGEYRWILDHGVPRFASDGAFLGYIGSCIDMTERRRGEEELEKERRFLRQVIDIDPNFIFAKDRKGRFTLVNQAVADAYGTSVNELIGKTDADFNSNHDEVNFFRRTDLAVMDTLDECFIPEESITDAEGKVRWLQTVKRPIIGKDGIADQVLGASTDITQRKRAESELQRNRQELAHVARLSAMGELAASLAHELNQPLTAILANAQAAQRFLAAKPADLAEVHEILKDIVQDNNRAGEIIRRMRAMVRKEELEFAPIFLASVISDVVLLIHSDAVLHNIRVSLESGPDLPHARGDKVQLQQVILNLLLNAFDAMKNCPVSERHVNVSLAKEGVRWLRVAVHDRGTGLSEDKLDKVFQPFYTTKREGLGMGLSISRSIIEAHGGHLWAENNSDGPGASFYFTVPVEKAMENGRKE